MILNLFKRKPIYQVTYPSIPTKEEYESMKKALRDELSDQYKVVIIIDVHKVYIETKILK